MEMWRVFAVLLIIQISSAACPVLCKSKARNGKCDSTCNSAECDFDGRDCIPSCPQSCPSLKIGDSHCQPECNVQTCLYDKGDCLNECTEGCLHSMLGDGVCQQACNNFWCQYDKNECGCTAALLGNGICDPPCQNATFFFDAQDCAEFIYVNASLPALTGTGSRVDPYLSWSLALAHPFTRSQAGVCFLEGLHLLLNESRTWFDANITHLFLTCRFCADCGSQANLLLLQPSFLKGSLTSALVENLRLDGTQRIVPGCTELSCAFCMSWKCNVTHCYSQQGLTALKSATAPCPLVLSVTPAVLQLNATAQILAQRLSFVRLGEVSSMLLLTCSAAFLSHIEVNEVELNSYAVQLNGQKPNDTLSYRSQSSALWTPLNISPFLGLLTAEVTNLTVRSVNVFQSLRSITYLVWGGQGGALQLSEWHQAVVTDVVVQDLLNYAGLVKSPRACLSLKSVDTALVRNCKLQRISTKGNGLVFETSAVNLRNWNGTHVDVRNLEAQDSLFMLGAVLSVTSMEGMLNPNIRIQGVTVRSTMGTALDLAFHSEAPECFPFVVKAYSGPLAPRYVEVEGLALLNCTPLDAPLLQFVNPCHLQMTEILVASSTEELSKTVAGQLEVLNLTQQEVVLSSGSDRNSLGSILVCSQGLLQLRNALNISLWAVQVHSNLCASSLMQVLNSSDVSAVHWLWENNTALTLGSSGLFVEDSFFHLRDSVFSSNVVRGGVVAAVRQHLDVRRTSLAKNIGAGLLLDSCIAEVRDSEMVETQGSAVLLRTNSGPVTLLSEAMLLSHTQGHAVQIADTAGLGVNFLLRNCSWQGGSLLLEAGSSLQSAFFQAVTFSEVAATNFQGSFTIMHKTGELCFNECLWQNSSGPTVLYLAISEAALVVFQSCLFQDNSASLLLSLPDEHALQHVFLQNCAFRYNQGQLFDLIYADVQITACHFLGNAGQDVQVARLLFNSSFVLTDGDFQEQTDTRTLFSVGQHSEVILQRTNFLRNSAAGALFTVTEARISLAYCFFAFNRAALGSLLVGQTASAFLSQVNFQTNQPKSALLDLTMSHLEVQHLKIESEAAPVLSLRQSSAVLRDIQTTSLASPLAETTDCTLQINDLHASLSGLQMHLIRSELQGGNWTLSRCSGLVKAQHSTIRLDLLWVEELGAPLSTESSAVQLQRLTCLRSAGCVSIQNSSLLLSDSQLEHSLTSALSLTDSHLLAERIEIRHNQAERGAGVYFACPCKCCSYVVTDSLFESNSAIQGAAVFYEDLRPDLRNVRMENNRASYGNDLGTVAQALVNISIWPEIVSGQDFLPPSFHLLDELGQVMSADNTSSFYLFVSTGTMQGSIRATADQGVFVLSAVRLTCPPNSSVEITATATGVSAVTFRVHVRPCLAGEVQQPDQSCFQCEAMTYSFEPSESSCLQCPEGAVCHGGNQVYPLPGYWRSSNVSSTFYACSQSCLGSPSRSNPLGECGQGYWSNLCGACVPGYFRFAEASCKNCPRTSVNVVLSLLLGVAYLCFLAKIVAGSISKAKKSETSLHLKLLLNYLQVTMLLGEFSLQWPDLLLQIFRSSALAGNSSQSLFALDCFLQDVYARHVVVSVIPLVQIGGSCLLWGGVALARRNWSYVRDHNLSTIMTLLLLLHSTLASSVFSLFACRSLDNGTWMQEDLSLQCWQGRHLFFALALGLPSLVVWVLGFPLAFGALLLGASREAHVTKLRYGFLYDGYKDHLYFWEAVVISRKVAVKAVSVVLSYSEPIQRAMAANVVIVSMLAMQLNYHPYKSERVNRIETLSMAANFLTLTLGTFFSKDNSQAITFVLFCSILGANFAFLLYWARSLVLASELCKRFRRKRTCHPTTDLSLSVSPCQDCS